MNSFMEDVKKFQVMYSLARPTMPAIVPEGLVTRQTQFMKIIRDEVEEGQKILDDYAESPDELKSLVELSDWLGDMIVYCTSEAMRYGIPIHQVLSIIMQSNFSKLDEQGQAIIKEGKVQKGPNYWKPEPAIEELLSEFRRPESSVAEPLPEAKKELA